MTLNGANVYCENVKLDQRSKLRIEEMVASLKEISSDAEVSLKLLKEGDIFEGLLWGRAVDSPIGIYTRGASLNRLLDTLQKKVSMESLKIWKNKGSALRKNNRSIRQPVLAEAG